MTNPYDAMYKTIDFSKAPFRYPMDYYLWRAGKLKREIAKYIKKDGDIIDVGGGAGIMTRFLPGFVDRNRYVNLDVSREILKYCKHRTVVAPAEDIPFPDNSFDYVLTSEVLEHVKDKIQTLKECYRVLKPGGSFMLTTPRTGWSRDYILSPFSLFYLIHIFIYLLQSVISPNLPSLETDVRDEPSDESWLKHVLEKIGFKVMVQHRIDNHVPWKTTGKFWRKFADRLIDPKKYGLCTFVMAVKQ